MDRREFLKFVAAGGALYSAAGLPLLGGNIVHASGFPTTAQRTLVNIMLFGGPDLRHLFPAPYETDQNSYGYLHWKSKAQSHSIADSTAALEDRWNNDYFHVGDSNTEFGILKKCGWLKSMWDSGNVALVCNAVGSLSRDHNYSQLIMDQGDLTSAKNERDKPGWGGRLTTYLNSNVLSLTTTPRVFCYGPDPDDPLLHDSKNLVAIRNTRDFGLENAVNMPEESGYSVLSRSLRSYYEAKQAEIDPDSVYARFVAHEQTVRSLGDLIKERLATIPLPGSIAGLMTGGLSDPYLGEQIRNLYDSFACSDILNFRAVSLEYGPWDSHQNQKDLIEPKLENLFGNGKALDTLYQELPPGVVDNMVLVIEGEFGRQIKANKDNGTDHGRGNIMMVIGNRVSGGIYGDMFPEDELARLDQLGPDITGLTELDHVFGAVSDWIAPGGSGVVFPGRSTAALEAGVDLSNLVV